jgi:hypothetical protein
MLALSLLLLSDLVNVCLSLYISNPCLTFLNTAFTSFTPNQVYTLVRIYHRAISWRFCNSLPFALLELVYHWSRASTLHGIDPLLSHVIMISPCLYVSIMFYHPREYHLRSSRWAIQFGSSYPNREVVLDIGIWESSFFFLSIRSSDWEAQHKQSHEAQSDSIRCYITHAWKEKWHG